MFKNVKAVLIDLSGTLHIENQVTNNGLVALQQLRQTKLKIRFVTNTTKESKNDLHSRLTNIGYNIHKNEIFSSLSSAKELVHNLQIRPHLLLSESAKTDFEGINQQDPNAVVIGLAKKCFDYDQLNQAFRILMNGGTLIAINKSRYYQTPSGLALAAGPFVSALEFASGMKATLVGKPSEVFFQKSVESFGLNMDQCVMIGDDVKDDIEGARNVGMKTILVQTGKYLEGDEDRISPPAFVARDFAEAVQLILNDTNA